MMNFKHLTLLVFMLFIGGNWSFSTELSEQFSHTPPSRGAYKKYHPNGQVKESGVFVRHRYRYVLTRFYDNGQVLYEANYNNKGKEDGVVKYFFPNGQLEFEYTAINGVPTGKAYRYTPTGAVRESLEFDTRGTLIAKVEFSIEE